MVSIQNGARADDDRLDRIFAALSDRTRRAILARLARGDATVGELADPFDMSRPAISKHIRVLEDAGLVTRTPDGRMTRCGLEAGPMEAAADWVDRYRAFWEGRFDALARYLETADFPVDPATTAANDDEEEEGT